MNSFSKEMAIFRDWESISVPTNLQISDAASLLDETSTKITQT